MNTFWYLCLAGWFVIMIASEIWECYSMNKRNKVVMETMENL